MKLQPDLSCFATANVLTKYTISQTFGTSGFFYYSYYSYNILPNLFRLYAFTECLGDTSCFIQHILVVVTVWL